MADISTANDPSSEMNGLGGTRSAAPAPVVTNVINTVKHNELIVCSLRPTTIAIIIMAVVIVVGVWFLATMFARAGQAAA
jgi:hypothetical protein